MVLRGGGGYEVAITEIGCEDVALGVRSEIEGKDMCVC